MGLRDPHRRGGLGGSPFLGVFGGLWGSILGFCVENPPQMGLGGPNAEDLGGVPISGGLWGWILGFCEKNPPGTGGQTPVWGAWGVGRHFWGSLGGFYEENPP